MSTISSTTNYVKFIRGTPTAFNNLASKNADTLYFISESDAIVGSLYLGNKLIGSSTSLSQLTDLVLSSVADGDVLIYDSTTSKWKNVPATNMIGIMQGASNISAGAAGLVPVPAAGDQNKFLRGDGTWAIVPTGNTFDTNIFEISTSNVVSLKDFVAAEANTIPQKNSSGSISWVAPSTLYADLAATVSQLQTTVNGLQGGLQRIIKSTISDIDTSATDADKYIYMVPNNSGTTGNIYSEYMVIQGNIEKIGTDLSGEISGYVTETTFNTTINGLANIYVSQTSIGDLNSLILFEGNDNLVEQVNDLSERLTWYQITND